MARVIYSPLIADIRGKTADVVFASWKGRAYIRQRVIPANPQSAAQTAVRNSLAEAVALWHVFPAALKVGFGAGAADLSISGYNDWVGRNRLAIEDETGLIGPRRDNDVVLPYITIPTDYAYDSEPGAGQFTCTWTDPGQGADYRMGGIIYNATDNVLKYVNININALSFESITWPSGAIGDVMLTCAFVYRVSDGAFVHFGTVAHTQAS